MTEKKKVLIPIPKEGFDPTEVAVTWKILKDHGTDVYFATPDGNPGKADPIMVSGKGLGPFKYMMRADGKGREAYSELLQDSNFREPTSYDSIKGEDYDGLVLGGGHAKEIKEYLESTVLQGLVAYFFLNNKAVGAICHGVVLASRAIDEKTGRSVLFGRKTTALPRWMELLAWNLTRSWMGNYYRTYPSTTVEGEVRENLGENGQFLRGPFSLQRDCPTSLERGFVVEDGNYISARWPGDAHRLGMALVELLDKGGNMNEKMGEEK